VLDRYGLLPTSYAHDFASEVLSRPRTGRVVEEASDLTRKPVTLMPGEWQLLQERAETGLGGTCSWGMTFRLVRRPLHRWTTKWKGVI
jgi:hypothetical protein